MNKLVLFITTKVLPNIVMLTVVGTTVAVAVYSANKISDPAGGLAGKSIKEVILSDTGSSSLDSESNNQDNDGKASGATNLCVVTISGKKFNVFDLKKTHSGGDVFKCNTDMSSSYISQHGSDLSRMNKYLINPTQSTTGAENTTNDSSTGKKEFTKTSLASHNKGTSCYVAYGGKVYNLTGNINWTDCTHHGITGGKDITSIFPHSTSYFSSIPVVGKFVGSTTTSSGNDLDDDEDEDEKEDDDEKEDEDEDEFEIEDEDEEEIEIEIED